MQEQYIFKLLRSRKTQRAQLPLKSKTVAVQLSLKSKTLSKLSLSVGTLSLKSHSSAALPEMDRSWMYNMTNIGRMGLMPEFVAGVDGFVDYVMTLEPFQLNGLVKCPCRKCKCRNYEKPDIVKLHLYRNGFKEDYTVWTSHGEVDNSFVRSQNYVAGGSSGVVEPDVQNYRMNDMIRYAYGMHSDFESGDHVEEAPNDESKCFFEQLEAFSRPLYEGSPHSQLSIAVRLLSIKSDWNVPQGAMDAVIDLMHELVDPNLEIPDNFYKAKRLDYIDLESCKFCQRAHFKKAPSGKKVDVKAMHYLPLIPRLKRLYASNRSAPHMRWHHKNRRPPGVMCHPSDGEAWKHFDTKYPKFSAEPRNIRLGLCLDGFTPYSIFAAPYSYWPVYLAPYNLPPEMCMNSPYIFLNCIILGPRNPKIMIDVYFQPLIDELNQLWIERIEIFDVSLKQNFNLRVVLMWTISDFSAYGMLSGWMTAGKLACPYCMENTKSFTFKHANKNCWFDCYRRFLPMDHEFRNMKNEFRNNTVDRHCSPPIYTGEQVWERVQHFPKVTEEQPYKFDGYGVAHNWTKQSIFWELSYWKDRLLRHNLDPMHTEKNYFDNLFNTVMNVNGKTKDNIRARMDLPEYCRRKELWLQEKSNKKVFKPKLKILVGHASNLGKRVDMEHGKLFGMKSHDCHVFMETLLPIAFSSLPERIWKPMTEISLFFKDLYSSTLMEENLVRMEQNIPVITNKLEKILPPGFWDVMEHLPVHLVHEARLGGPVQYRWMYPFERVQDETLETREKNKRPRWILPENWHKLVDHWETDSRFKQIREIGKKARASLKGGSLHTSRAQSQGNEMELGRTITQVEASKATHTRKKKTPEDPTDVWVEPRAR
ncbi:hypothetical protein P3S68_016133 [Capsicum galapagoense]